MTVSVRPIRPADLDELLMLCAEHAAFERAPFETAGQHASLVRALFEEPVRLRGWMAQDDRPIGYLTATLDFSTWRARDFLHMDCLFVREGYRGAGVGLQLFDALYAHAKAIGVDEIQWQTPDWNHDAARFYRRLGAGESHKLRYRYLLDAQC